MLGRMRVRAGLTIAGLAAVFAASLALRAAVGGSADTEIIAIRLGRAATGAIVGASLSVAGVFLQGLLRNPLASPDLLGLASGSGFAVLLSVHLGFVTAGALGASGLGAASATAAAVAGALGALGLTYVLSRRGGVLDPVLLVLTGVAVSILCSAGSMLMRHLLPYQQSDIADRMLRGALREEVGGWEYLIVGGVLAGSITAGMYLGRAMDAAALGEDEAISVGVPLAGLRRTLFVLSGVLTAGSVVLAGPIGFVGLICPHVVRMVAGPGHRALVPGAALAGASLVVFADVVVRTIQLPSGRLPISVLTAIIGGPVFVAILRGNRAQV